MELRKMRERSFRVRAAGISVSKASWLSTERVNWMAAAAHTAAGVVLDERV